MPFKRGEAYYFEVLVDFGAVIYYLQSFIVKRSSFVAAQPL